MGSSADANILQQIFFPRKQNSQILHSTLLTQQSAHFERIEPTISRDRQKISKNGSYPIFWTVMRYGVSHLGKKLSEKKLKFIIWGWGVGCNEFIFYSIFIWLTLFSLYFSILRTICFLTFFDSRPPSFAKLTFCRFKFSKEAVGTKFGYFLSEYFLGTNCMPL